MLIIVFVFHVLVASCSAQRPQTVTRYHFDTCNSVILQSSPSIVPNTTSTSSSTRSSLHSSSRTSSRSHRSSSTTETASSSSPSATNRVVLPALDEDVDRSALSNSYPSMNAVLHSAETNGGPQTLDLLLNMTSPQVKLENSDCVAIVSCNPGAGELDVGFSSETCYDIAMPDLSELFKIIIVEASRLGADEGVRLTGRCLRASIYIPVYFLLTTFSMVVLAAWTSWQ